MTRRHRRRRQRRHRRLIIISIIAILIIIVLLYDFQFIITDTNNNNDSTSTTSSSIIPKNIKPKQQQHRRHQSQKDHLLIFVHFHQSAGKSLMAFLRNQIGSKATKLITPLIASEFGLDPLKNVESSILIGINEGLFFLLFPSNSYPSKS